jgi:hypothetical protein
MRWITGILFGMGTGGFALPYVDQSFRELGGTEG